jgi:hypothetical protein
MQPRQRFAKALAAALLLTSAGVALAWQGQLVWTHGLERSGQVQDAVGDIGGAALGGNAYFRSGGVPGQALYGWSYPFAFPHDPLAAVQKLNGGGSR